MANLGNLFAIAGKLDGKLKRSLRYTIAPGVLNLGGAFVLGYGILASLIVNGTFAVLGMKDAMVSPDELPHEKMKRELAGDA